MEDKIVEILNNFETITYPNGVGSIFRCIEPHNYRRVAKEIVKLINKNHDNKKIK